MANSKSPIMKIIRFGQRNLKFRSRKSKTPPVSRVVDQVQSDGSKKPKDDKLSVVTPVPVTETIHEDDSHDVGADHVAAAAMSPQGIELEPPENEALVTESAKIDIVPAEDVVEDSQAPSITDVVPGPELPESDRPVLSGQSSSLVESVDTATVPIEVELPDGLREPSMTAVIPVPELPESERSVLCEQSSVIESPDTVIIPTEDVLPAGSRAPSITAAAAVPEPPAPDDPTPPPTPPGSGQVVQHQQAPDQSYDAGSPRRTFHGPRSADSQPAGSGKSSSTQTRDSIRPVTPSHSTKGTIRPYRVSARPRPIAENQRGKSTSSRHTRGNSGCVAWPLEVRTSESFSVRRISTAVNAPSSTVSSIYTGDSVRPITSSSSTRPDPLMKSMELKQGTSAIITIDDHEYIVCLERIIKNSSILFPGLHLSRHSGISVDAIGSVSVGYHRTVAVDSDLWLVRIVEQLHNVIPTAMDTRTDSDAQPANHAIRTRPIEPRGHYTTQSEALHANRTPTILCLPVSEDATTRTPVQTPSPPPESPGEPDIEIPGRPGHLNVNLPEIPSLPSQTSAQSSPRLMVASVLTESPLPVAPHELLPIPPRYAYPLPDSPAQPEEKNVPRDFNVTPRRLGHALCMTPPNPLAPSERSTPMTPPADVRQPPLVPPGLSPLTGKSNQGPPKHNVAGLPPPSPLNLVFRSPQVAGPVAAPWQTTAFTDQAQHSPYTHSLLLSPAGYPLPPLPAVSPRSNLGGEPFLAGKMSPMPDQRRTIRKPEGAFPQHHPKLTITPAGPAQGSPRPQLVPPTGARAGMNLLPGNWGGPMPFDTRLRAAAGGSRPVDQWAREHDRAAEEAMRAALVGTVGCPPLPPRPTGGDVRNAYGAPRMGITARDYFVSLRARRGENPVDDKEYEEYEDDEDDYCAAEAPAMQWH